MIRNGIIIVLSGIGLLSLAMVVQVASKVIIAGGIILLAIAATQGKDNGELSSQVHVHGIS